MECGEHHAFHEEGRLEPELWNEWGWTGGCGRRNRDTAKLL